MARSVAVKLAPLAEEAGLHLCLDFPNDLPEINGDRGRLEQVLTNLVENAIKFTPAGGEIVVSAQLAEIAPPTMLLSPLQGRGGESVCLTVADTGIGIPVEEQEKVFDRFYQVDGSERRAYRGAGLGLSICRHIVERHNGRIWVESEGVAGRGSRFHIELPIALQLAEPPTIDFTTPGPGMPARALGR
jgi:signal transduction histidine kinase